MAGRRQCRQTAAGRRRGQGPGAAKKERAAPRLRGRQSEAGAARAAELLRRRPGLARLRDDALRRQRAFERKGVSPQAAEGAEPDEPRPRGEASLRRYGRELRKVLAASDVVLEVLDARDPQGCRSPRLEAAVRRAGPCKRLVLVLNKIDLVSRDVVAKWLKFLRAEFPTVAFKACTQQQSRNLKQSRGAVATVPEEVLAGAGCVGADCLLQVLANYSRSQDVKTAITVGVVGECWGEGFADAWALPLKPSPRRPTGFPNVGKSSLINSLKRSRACRVGAQPGITKCGSCTGCPPARTPGACWHCWPGGRAACAPVASPTPALLPPPCCATGPAGRSPTTPSPPRHRPPPPRWMPVSCQPWHLPSTWKRWNRAMQRPWQRCQPWPVVLAWLPAPWRKRRPQVLRTSVRRRPWRMMAATWSLQL
ncbi:guanine nucleotide-binding protein-like 3-like protein isoform X6 [Rhea pennata]|uniref:guanine nucleotide-binding protein-like 3-like protein isoform X6 n=1 Tax=Rhea pennata TaxID=8795 RepID=UPI002E26B78C